MFGDTLTIKGFGGVGDTTGTAATFNKISSIGRGARYGLSTNTPSDSTYLDIKYQESSPKRYKPDQGERYLATSTIRKFLVKVTRRKYDSGGNRWVTATTNLTHEYEAEMTVIPEPDLKATVGYAANLALVTANFAKLFAQEA